MNFSTRWFAARTTAGGARPAAEAARNARRFIYVSPRIWSAPGRLELGGATVSRISRTEQSGRGCLDRHDPVGPRGLKTLRRRRLIPGAQSPDRCEAFVMARLDRAIAHNIVLMTM